MKILCFSLLVLISTCTVINNSASEGPISFATGDTITVAYQDTVVYSEEGISLAFDSLLSESRCPINAECVWEGDAELRFTFLKDQKNAIIELHSNTSFTTDTTVFRYHIELIDVHPHPHTDSSYVADDYSAVISITRAP